MKRREAIQQIAVTSVALALWPSCNVQEIPNYSRIPLDRTQWKLMQHFSEAILPVDHEVYKTLEPRANFVMTVINDCMPPADLLSFKDGFQIFQSYLDKEGKKSLHKLSDTELETIFNHLEQSKATSPNLFLFYQTTRNLAKQHFTTSEKYMTEHEEFKFVPGDYLGCVNI